MNVPQEFEKIELEVLKLPPKKKQIKIPEMVNCSLCNTESG